MTCGVGALCVAAGPVHFARNLLSRNRCATLAAWPAPSNPPTWNGVELPQSRRILTEIFSYGHADSAVMRSTRTCCSLLLRFTNGTRTRHRPGWAYPRLRVRAVPVIDPAGTRHSAGRLNGGGELQTRGSHGIAGVRLTLAGALPVGVSGNIHERGIMIGRLAVEFRLDAAETLARTRGIHE